MQVLPAPQLALYIKHYLWVQKPATVGGQLRMFSDGNPGIAFCCEGSLYADALHKNPYPAIFAYGQIDTHRVIYASENVKLLIAVMHPYGLSSLMRAPAQVLNNEILNDEVLFSPAFINDAKALLYPIDITTRLTKADKLFGRLLTDRLMATESLLAATIEHVRKLNGNVNSAGFSNFTGFSERYLEKKFKEHIGMSPKKFARITRMLSFIKSLQAADDASTLTVQAYRAGYFDQAHLNHDFKALTGTTPSEFAAQRQSLALNLFTLRKD
ncbi:AraC family transcriptional regulator [Mucilaginibacter conchicola]|uniref:AraC family transcriptional regulator n=1 Tax=Mucilaginibacter conchicola TaxID=2303333 RepID=A0A372NXS8_9SPHI|nr:helix-turn-helix domain-containing protein [Mucilaginibacter conchicola]RFZ94923.1 AraC family transcriptional regulator [Mucilaginibacter conchicola]